jgi:hypothetical protein
MGRSSENHVNLISGPIRVTDGKKGVADELETRPSFASEDIRQTVGSLFDVSTSLQNKNHRRLGSRDEVSAGAAGCEFAANQD